MSRRFLLLIRSLALFAAAATASAATIEVEQIDGRLFSPATVTINVGDTVLWRNVSSAPHTTTSGVGGTPDGLFDSLNMNTGDTFSYTFDSPGSYDYYCDYHLPDMVGVVEVVAPAGDGIILKLAKRWGGASAARTALEENLGMAPKAKPAPVKAPEPKAAPAKETLPGIRPPNPALHREIAQVTPRGS